MTLLTPIPRVFFCRLFATQRGTPVAAVRKRLLALRPTYDLYILPNETLPQSRRARLARPIVTARFSALELKCSFDVNSATVGASARGATQPVAVAEHSIASILSGRDEYLLTLAAGVEPLLFACAMCALDDNESRERHRL